MADIIAFFPGQGSQKVGMGKELFERFDIAKNIFKQADEALGFSLSSICFEGPTEKLTLTEIAQPAILTVSVICFELAKEQLNASHRIVAAAGHSLGEYSALVAAGALKFSDAVSLVNKRGKFMQEAVPVGTGKMVAVLGKDVAEIEAALTKVSTGVAQIANINAPGQVVVAGSADGVTSFVEALGSAKVVELSVSAPFHCSLMKPAEDKLRPELVKVTVAPPLFPVIHNYTADTATTPEVIKENLALQVCGRVRWVECVEKGIALGAPSAAWEFGAGNVLTGLAKRIAPNLTRVNIDSPESLEKSLAA
jgi:[acyl-carrier-protein] S-malonyltransferase